MSQAVVQPTTAETLLERSERWGRCELIEGEVIEMAPTGAEHGELVHQLDILLGLHVRRTKQGKVYVGEVGFLLSRNPDTVRAADVAFVRKSRLPAQRQRRYFDGAPDLAVEVVSPHDKASDIAGKVAQWLSAGSAAVWVVDASQRTVTVYHDTRHATILHDDDTLDGGDVLPGLSVPVAELFADPLAP
jgi:Uma2 family endonuclease